MLFGLEEKFEILEFVARCLYIFGRGKSKEQKIQKKLDLFRVLYYEVTWEDTH